MDEWRAIVTKARKDPKFKAKLLKDPNTVLKAYGIKVPRGVKYKVVEDELKGQRHLVLPPDEKDPSLVIDSFDRDPDSGDPGF
jgi:hypothetical protein